MLVYPETVANVFMMMWKIMPGMMEPDLILTMQMIMPTTNAQAAQRNWPWQKPNNTEEMSAATIEGIALLSLVKR